MNLRTKPPIIKKEFVDFDDLIFGDHFGGITNKRSEYNFANGYGVSIVFGEMFYSNGIDTYEIAILKNGNLSYETDITNDVIGYQSETNISHIMKYTQLLNDDGKLSKKHLKEYKELDI